MGNVGENGTFISIFPSNWRSLTTEIDLHAISGGWWVILRAHKPRPLTSIFSSIFSASDLSKNENTRVTVLKTEIEIWSLFKGKVEMAVKWLKRVAHSRMFLFSWYRAKRIFAYKWDLSSWSFSWWKRVACQMIIATKSFC